MISFDPIAKNTPTPVKEMNAPITPIRSSFRLPVFSIFEMAINVKVEFQTS
jgi:hypothetical protein